MYVLLKYEKDENNFRRSFSNYICIWYEYDVHSNCISTVIFTRSRNNFNRTVERKQKEESIAVNKKLEI
jgi:hypothetical protein